MPTLKPSTNGKPHTAKPTTPHNRLQNMPVIPGGRQGRQVGGHFTPIGQPLGEVVDYLAKYVALPRRQLLVIATYIAAAYVVDQFDKFPLLSITSPEKRCGKTLLLQLLYWIAPKPYNSSSISPPALYRLIEKECPTLLLDEAQCLNRRGSESAHVLLEIFCAGIEKDASVTRCAGKNTEEPTKFKTYGPKIIALIGKVQSVRDITECCVL